MNPFAYCKKIIVYLILMTTLSVTHAIFASALIHASVTGRVWGHIQRYHGRIVRFTLRDRGWPNALHDIVIKPYTQISREGSTRVNLSPNVIHSGQAITAQGGVTTFGNRIVADRIVILSR